ncbi:MAG TPA: hypothetical protein VF869_06415 [Jatrophihabitantaceae bacterium]
MLRVAREWTSPREGRWQTCASSPIAGGSVIVGPLDVLAGPRIGGEGLVCAPIDTADLAGARYDLDVVGHYARPDVFTLHVDETARSAVSFD